MTGRVIVAVRADDRATTCALVDVVTLGMIGVPVASPYNAGLEGVSDVVERVLWHARRGDLEVAGLGMALPEDDSWRDIGRSLAARLGLFSTTQRIAEAAMRGEQLRGAASGRSSALLFDTDDLRVSLVLNGSPYDGVSGTAGNVAHLGIDRTGHTRCSCGRIGCLAALVRAGPETPVPPMPADIRPMPSHRHGWLAVASIALLNVVNPEVLILGGSAVEAGPEFEWLASAVREGCLAPTRVGLADVARARADSTLLGAAALTVARQSQPAMSDERGTN